MPGGAHNFKYVDAIVAFDSDKGVGHLPRSGSTTRGNPEKDWILWNEMTTAAKERGLTLSRHPQNLQNAKECIEQYDKREEKRLDIPKDLNLSPIHIDSSRPVIIMLCSRDSGYPLDVDLRIQKDDIEKARVRGVLEGGKILHGLKEATYINVYRWHARLGDAVPLTSR